ncbi:MAG: hypothetical protein Q8M98_05230 [Candidatus Cloacimonadaceae bacterium]|nr:hypothetical protein [Candidatus Cloacimonadaceae bacterium]
MAKKKGGKVESPSSEDAGIPLLLTEKRKKEKTMFELSLAQMEKVVRYFSIGIWGKKAIIPGTDWCVECIACWIRRYCLKYKVDMILALAQGVVECHFGVNPAAVRSRKTKNIYNVGNVDSGANETQISWEAGIERYCKLMSREYNRQEEAGGYVSLASMVKHDFTRPRGGRFASAPGYTKLVEQLGWRIRKLVESD